ncbi:MAG: OsmC family protein [Dehalococcoidia bacterium]|nr:OsmC family protein [Dehalococcoidia bacterium]
MTQISQEPKVGVRNGVDTVALFETINVVKENPELGRAQFRATNQWVSGTHSRGTISTFFAAGGEQQHIRETVLDADHPTVLVGSDQGPTPVEYLLHALAACLTAGIGNIAAARGVKLNAVESSVEGDADLRGILGLADDVRNGFSNVRVRFSIDADADEDTIRQIVERSRARSAVFDVITNGVPVSIDIEAR